MSGAAPRPGLAIVIVNYRSWEALAACLPTIEGEDREIVVVDNHSADGRLAGFAARHPRVRFLENDRNAGFAAGCNLGARGLAAPWLLFLNPDTRDPGGQIAALHGAAERGNAAVVTCRQVDGRGRAQKVFDRFPGPATALGTTRALLRLLRPGAYPDSRRCRDAWREVDWVSGSALLIRREVFEAIGGWDERFFLYSEDVDLCRRVRDAGRTVAFTAEAELIHAHGGASRASPGITAFARTHATISRHLYGEIHLRGPRRTAYELVLLLGRDLPALLLGALAAVAGGRRAAARKLAARHLLRALALRLRAGSWAPAAAELRLETR